MAGLEKEDMGPGRAAADAATGGDGSCVGRRVTSDKQYIKQVIHFASALSQVSQTRRRYSTIRDTEKT